MDKARNKSQESDELKKSAKKSTRAASTQEESANSAEVTPATDTYETSRSAKAFPVREHKIEQARKNIEAGAYDSQEVRDAIVKRLVDALTG